MFFGRDFMISVPAWIVYNFFFLSFFFSLFFALFFFFFFLLSGDGSDGWLLSKIPLVSFIVV